ncbi:hypothetical protein ACOME3_007160 [Neoechinorhynchus agilis]
MLYIAHISLVPLYKKDGLLLESFCLGHINLGLHLLIEQFTEIKFGRSIEVLRSISLLFGFLLSYASLLFVEPPRRYPDIVTVALYSYCFVHFATFLIWGHLNILKNVHQFISRKKKKEH